MPSRYYRIPAESYQWGRELWLACWMVAMQATLHHTEDRSSRLSRWYNLRTTDDSNAECPRSTGRRR